MDAALPVPAVLHRRDPGPKADGLAKFPNARCHRESTPGGDFYVVRWRGALVSSGGSAAHAWRRAYRRDPRDIFDAASLSNREIVRRFHPTAACRLTVTGRYRVEIASGDVLAETRSATTAWEAAARATRVAP